jgi:hypothetical protein
MFTTSLYSRRASFFSSSSVMMTNLSEYREVYGGGADDRVEGGEVGREAPLYVFEVW